MPAKKETVAVHIRRCHVCGTVNELLGAAIHKCQDCGKHLAPFYYFDESDMQGLDADGFYLSTYKQSAEAKDPSLFFPLWGFSHYWVDQKS